MYKIEYLNHNWLSSLLHNRVFLKKLIYIKGRVVDLGCGTAPYKADVESVGASYIGVDWSNSVHNIQPDVVADLSKSFPFKDGYADTLLSFQVMEHLPTPQHFLNESYRILEKGGTLLLSVPFMWQIHEAPHDYFRYTRYGLEYLFKEAGFGEITIEEIGGFWYTWLLKINYLVAAKTAKSPLKYLFVPWWFLNQLLALGLDKLITRKQETGGYMVTATK